MLEFLKNLAFQAGEICLEAAGNQQAMQLEFKSEKDLVTAIDKKVEDFLRDNIINEYPEHGIVGEERGVTEGEGTYRWVIDPIDGTVSFVHGLPGYSISLALQREGITQWAVVYGPLLGQMFSAERGGGVFLNSQPIQVSTCTTMINSVWATGFACLRAGAKNNNLPHFTEILLQIRDIRRMGSAALDLAYVAAGKIDGFWELCLADHDVVAGVLLVEEAGGEVCDFQGGDQFPQQGIVATNGLLTSKIRTILDRH